MLVELDRTINDAATDDLWAVLAMVTSAMHERGTPDVNDKVFMILYHVYRLLAGAADDRMSEEYSK